MSNSKHHNHERCVASALESAAAICTAKGLRLTPLRRQVLELVWHSHRPLGAYLLMEMLAKQSDRKQVAPPTVYRALDFLVKQGLIHRVHTLNAFIGCSHPIGPHSDVLFICRQCQMASEIRAPEIYQAINACAADQQFVVVQQILEVVGLCASCEDPSP